LAQASLGTWDLGAERDLALVVNWRPCVQCYGAAMWSGIKHLVIAGAGPELEQLTGFDEGPMVADWAEQFERRGIHVVQDVGRDDALAVFRAYGASGAVVYNPRGASTN
jgi:tRNA(Arg) A34 adenosine deaminase TadA